MEADCCMCDSIVHIMHKPDDFNAKRWKIICNECYVYHSDGLNKEYIYLCGFFFETPHTKKKSVRSYRYV